MSEEVTFFFSFFLASCFSKPLNLFWVYQNGNFLPGKSISRRGKHKEKLLCPSEKISLAALQTPFQFAAPPPKKGKRIIMDPNINWYLRASGKLNFRFFIVFTRWTFWDHCQQNWPLKTDRNKKNLTFDLFFNKYEMVRRTGSNYTFSESSRL